MRRSVRLLSWMMIGCIGICGCSRKSSKPEVDYQAAEKEFDEYMQELELPSFFFATGGESKYRYDVTGDGVEDLLRGGVYGSGIIRETVFVYDPVTHTGRWLVDSKDGTKGGEFDATYHFTVDSCKEDGLVIERNNQLTLGDDDIEGCLGTIILQEDELVFVPFNDDTLSAKGK